MRHVGLALLFAVAFPLLAHAQPHVDLDTGIAFTPPDKWNQIPTPKRNKYDRDDGTEQYRLIAKWESARPDADGNPIGLDLFCIPGVTTLDAAAEAWKKRQGEAFTVRKTTELRAGGGRTRLVSGDADGTGRVAGLYCNGERGFALVFSCGAARTANQVGEWTKTLQTFRILSAGEIAKLRTAPRTLPPGWQLRKTASYDIEFNCDKEFAATIGVQLEAILLEYQKFFPLDTFGRQAVTVEGKESEKAPAPKLERMTVKLFKDNTTFQAYAHANGVTNAMAYFSPAQNELVGYKTTNEGQKLSIKVMYHEAMHQYLHALFGESVDIPSWLNEGMAEYFFGGDFQDRTGRFVIGVNKERIDTIRLACKNGSYVPLAKFFGMSQAEYYAHSSLCYAQGWSLAYFLWRTEDAKYRGLIETYMKRLRETKSTGKAFQESFGTVDLEQLEKDWVEYVSRRI